MKRFWPASSSLLPHWLLSVVFVSFFAAQASALGLGIGIEGGGYAGKHKLLEGALTSPSLYGGGLSLLVSAEFYDDNFLRAQAIARLEGSGFGLQSAGGAGAGGVGLGDLLLRFGLAIPLSPVEPFVELGGGAFVGSGGGTLDASLSGALDNTISAQLWGPAAYLGAGLTVALPLLPYFELRVGTHVGQLQTDGAPSALAVTGRDAWLGRAEAHLGMGFRL